MALALLLLACESKAPDTGSAEEEDTAADSPADSPADTSDDTDDTGEYVPEACPEDTSTAPPCPEGPDGDEDGWTEEAGDCDDCDAATHPGASELCDGVDQDCDGAPVDGGSCIDGIDFAEHPDLPGWLGTEDDASIGVSGHDGRGIEEDLLFVGAAAYVPAGASGSAAALAVVRDLPDAALQPFPSGAQLLTWAPEGTGGWGVGLPLGDHDGDGVSEVVLYTPSGSREEDGVYLVDLPEGPCTSGDFGHLARARWTVPEGDHDFAVGFDAAGDHDGDGVADMAILTSMRQVDWEDQPGRLYLVQGCPGLAGVHDPLDEVVLTGSGAGQSWRETPGDARALPDLDGDGASELLLDEGIFGRAIGSGRTVMASDGARFEDAFEAIEVSVYASPAQSYLSPGDWDGDGVDDLGWVMEGEEARRDDCLYIVSFPATYTGDVLDNTLQALCKPYAGSAGYLKGTHDLDGDGLLDPNFTWYGYAPEPETGWIGTQFVVPTSRLDGGRAEVAEVGIRIGVESDDFEREDLDFADLDDDGFPEVIHTHDEGPDAWLSMEGWVRVMAGAGIPFDDPTAW